MDKRRAKEPKEKIDVSWPMGWEEVAKLRNDYEAKGFAVEFKVAKDGSGKNWLYVYEYDVTK